MYELQDGDVIGRVLEPGEHTNRGRLANINNTNISTSSSISSINSTNSNGRTRNISNGG